VTLSGLDRAAFTDLVHRYAANVDDRRFDAVVELFTETAELILPNPPTALEPVNRHCGHTAIRVAVGAVAAVTRTEHAIVGEVYDDAERPDVAHGRVACIAHHWSQEADQLTDVIWHLRYDDKYQLTDGHWRIAKRTLTIDAIEIRPVRRLRITGSPD
jgi:3-phenylpropionate/cinnamic acid dioxygenase small subunit